MKNIYQLIAYALLVMNPQCYGAENKAFDRFLPPIQSHHSEQIPPLDLSRSSYELLKDLLQRYHNNNASIGSGKMVREKKGHIYRNSPYSHKKSGQNENVPLLEDIIQAFQIHWNYLQPEEKEALLPLTAGIINPDILHTLDPNYQRPETILGCLQQPLHLQRGN
ncbi:MAG: hypothetical protein H6679_01375 [Epsilonproteobacteria bacterium]|nr:hypothetical protein [Campylobacterota bacterium]